MLDKNQIINLDECVINALNLFIREKIPLINILNFKRLLVVGSGNAAAAGRIMFEKTDAIFADESSYETRLKNISEIDAVVVISASGGKHAPIIAKKANLKYKKRVILLTNNKDAAAKRYAHETQIFPKNPEPYTYNTSTYMGMILAQTHEDPKKILQFINKRIAKIRYPDFGRYNKYFLVVPPEFEGIIKMLNVKFMELFGRQIARDVETTEAMKHATTVVPSEDELFICFGRKNKYGADNFFVPLPANADYGAMMAVSYYIIGKIQRYQQPWFRDNIEEYCKKASKIFKQEIKPIVE